MFFQVAYNTETTFGEVKVRTCFEVLSLVAYNSEKFLDVYCKVTTVFLDIDVACGSCELEI